ncbi:bifunctional molybdenum cofactor biosynthesis protein MoaC/MoaB [Salinibacter altiplanensis]|uniref:bifunctional molybdenum cofactor biosynthesis protein MoaC/MoaB n=1 Tax=Salinibacter altiplanensis TaxID=1803181 RepID=UPI000C9EFBF5|nr:bifunctional molybdenum cofactor biosynthesis protein MoaC/MoaB [Salinibacter altiplanensis]
MIDVSHKTHSLRYARAEGLLRAGPRVRTKLREESIPKGNVQATARAAGIDAAKRTSEWVTFCQTLPLDWVDLHFEVVEEGLKVTAEAQTVWKTGVEIEVITAVSAALVNAYDMCKPLTDDLAMTDVRVVEKRGGYSNYRQEFENDLGAAALVVSDSTYAGDREDRSGTAIQSFLEDRPVEVVTSDVLPDEPDRIQDYVAEQANDPAIDLVFTTGGTGFGPRDETPEAIAPILDREAPGIAEKMRSYGTERTPYALLSRQVAGTIGETLVVTLPGSTSGVEESLHALFPGLLHIFPMMWGGGHEKPSDSS